MNDLGVEAGLLITRFVRVALSGLVSRPLGRVAYVRKVSLLSGHTAHIVLHMLLRLNKGCVGLLDHGGNEVLHGLYQDLSAWRLLSDPLLALFALPIVFAPEALKFSHHFRKLVLVFWWPWRHQKLLLDQLRWLRGDFRRLFWRRFLSLFACDG